MIRTTARVARKAHRCTHYCGNHIQSGDTYLEVVASPDHGDLSNPGWWRLAECAPCATRGSRGHLIEARNAA
jgi:hypothetical protein